MKQCKDCKWWEPDDFYPTNRCTHITVNGCCFGMETEGFYPDEDFGCVLWEGCDERD